jgi:MinD-like ATPase involved in chromosome partitioning or flagellar assembly
MRVVATYSYKGGAGRTLLLANLAVHLAKIGLTVVAADLDLEAPGLHYKLTRAAASKTGVVDFLCALKEGRTPSLREHLVAVTIDGPGHLWMLPAGSVDLPTYWRSLAKLDLGGWARTHAEGPSQAFTELLRQSEVDLHADVVLFDARTGVTDSNALGLSHADHVIGVLIASKEHADGTLAVLSSLKASGTDISVALSRVPPKDELAHSPYLSEQSALIEQQIADSVSNARVFRLSHDPILQGGESVALDSWARGRFGQLFDDYVNVASTTFHEFTDRLHEILRTETVQLLERLQRGADAWETEQQLRNLIETFSLPESRNALALLYRLKQSYQDALTVLLAAKSPDESMTEALPILRWLISQRLVAESKDVARIRVLANLKCVPQELRDEVTAFLERS